MVPQFIVEVPEEPEKPSSWNVAQPLVLFCTEKDEVIDVSGAVLSATARISYGMCEVELRVRAVFRVVRTVPHIPGPNPLPEV